jgi:hypothetical protein
MRTKAEEIEFMKMRYNIVLIVYLTLNYFFMFKEFSVAALIIRSLPEKINQKIDKSYYF